MKQKYKDWIIVNIRNGDLHTSTEWVEDFCDEFNLKKSFMGNGDIRNSTFNKALHELSREGLIEYWYRTKVSSFNGRGGGMLTCYQFTDKGFKYRESLSDS